jgi:hypothetical protein
MKIPDQFNSPVIELGKLQSLKELKNINLNEEKGNKSNGT